MSTRGGSSSRDLPAKQLRILQAQRGLEHQLMGAPRGTQREVRARELERARWIGPGPQPELRGVIEEGRALLRQELFVAAARAGDQGAALGVIRLALEQELAERRPGLGVLALMCERPQPPLGSRALSSLELQLRQMDVAHHVLGQHAHGLAIERQCTPGLRGKLGPHHAALKGHESDGER
jgi:hypothetical protein